jgi:cobalt-precorrin 5A hydrolase
MERTSRGKQGTALWALTPGGAALALALQDQLEDSELFVPESLETDSGRMDKSRAVHRFQSLKQAVSDHFDGYDAHVFFMAAGIVVRVIAAHIVHKIHDPAVVVVDDRGFFAVSLLSGHIGGANALALRVSAILGSTPVITTATDVNGLPSVDMMAVEKGLFIENPGAVKHVNMAFLNKKPVGLVDPYRFFRDKTTFFQPETAEPKVIIDDRLVMTGPCDLMLRPGTLVAGIGCNRGTEKQEIRDLLFETLEQNRLAKKSLAFIASVDVKQDETGILDLADELNLPLRFFSRDELNTVKNIETPSLTVEKHMGVKSVCEAAAILGSDRGTLIVPKRKSTNATVAVARMNCSS